MDFSLQNHEEYVRGCENSLVRFGLGFSLVRTIKNLPSKRAHIMKNIFYNPITDVKV